MEFPSPHGYHNDPAQGHIPLMTDKMSIYDEDTAGVSSRSYLRTPFLLSVVFTHQLLVPQSQKPERLQLL